MTASKPPFPFHSDFFRSLPLLSLSILTFIAGYAVVQHGAIRPGDWNACLLLLGLLGLAYRSLTPSRELAPPVELSLRWSFFLLVGYLVFQIIPFPSGLTQALSPSRAYFSPSPSSRLFGPVFSTFSVDPIATFAHLLRVAAYSLVFWLIRQLTYRLSQHPWLIVLPLVAIGTLEAIWGLSQVVFGPPHTVACGSYVAQGPYFVNRNHYAGLLEMTLPLAASLAILLSGHVRRSRGSALRVGALVVSSGLMFLAILHSLSRMGFIVALCSLYVIGFAHLGRRLSLRKQIALVGLPIFLWVGLRMLSTDDLNARFSEISSTDKVKQEGRLRLWLEAWELFTDYPLFGSGLGTLQTASLHPSKLLRRVHYAHNDYLQLLVELGIAGFTLFAVLLWYLFKSTARATKHPNANLQTLALGSTVAIGAIFLHSTVDFQLYVPGNALILAWICGIAAGLRFAAPRH